MPRPVIKLLVTDLDNTAALAKWPTPEARRRELDDAFHAFNRVRKQQLALYSGVRDTPARIGDSTSRDVGMAKQVGMHAAWAAHGTRHAARADSREQTRGDFRLMKRWTAPLHLDQDRLTLGDWEPAPA